MKRTWKHPSPGNNQNKNLPDELEQVDKRALGMKKLQSEMYYSGTSGLQLLIPQRLFPAPFEKSSRLTYYSSLYNSIEFNSSFYKIPQEATVSKWAESVVGNFRFTFKLWKNISHSKGLTFDKADVKDFFKSINLVGEKKACLLIQFPPGLGIENSIQLEKLLLCIKEVDNTHDWKVAIEFRNISWYHDRIFDLINNFKVAVVVHDLPKSATPLFEHESDFVYIRFHGPTGNYRGSYSNEFLNEYAARIQEWKEQGKKVYVYFNNTMGDASNNLKTLNGFIYNDLIGA